MNGQQASRAAAYQAICRATDDTVECEQALMQAYSIVSEACASYLAMVEGDPSATADWLQVCAGGAASEGAWTNVFQHTLIGFKPDTLHVFCRACVNAEAPTRWILEFLDTFHVGAGDENIHRGTEQEEVPDDTSTTPVRN